MSRAPTGGVSCDSHTHLGARRRLGLREARGGGAGGGHSGSGDDETRPNPQPARLSSPRLALVSQGSGQRCWARQGALGARQRCRQAAHAGEPSLAPEVTFAAGGKQSPLPAAGPCSSPGKAGVSGRAAYVPGLTVPRAAAPAREETAAPAPSCGNPSRAQLPPDRPPRPGPVGAALSLARRAEPLEKEETMAPEFPGRGLTLKPHSQTPNQNSSAQTQGAGRDHPAPERLQGGQTGQPTQQTPSRRRRGQQAPSPVRSELPSPIQRVTSPGSRGAAEDVGKASRLERLCPPHLPSPLTAETALPHHQTEARRAGAGLTCPVLSDALTRQV